MARNDVARVLDPEATLQRRLPQVAGHGGQSRRQAQHAAPEDIQTPHLQPARHGGARNHPGDQAADEARPGLVRRKTRPQLGPADRAADQIGQNVGRPGHGENQNGPVETLRIVQVTQPDQQDTGPTEVEHAVGRIQRLSATRTREQARRQSAEDQQDQRQRHLTDVGRDHGDDQRQRDSRPDRTPEARRAHARPLERQKTAGRDDQGAEPAAAGPGGQHGRRREHHGRGRSQADVTDLQRHQPTAVFASASDRTSRPPYRRSRLP
ncbi:hypothetical protein D3C72_726880 [compost metagenome]